jgi:hypothetical protein
MTADESRSRWCVPLGLAISLTLLIVLTQGGGIILTCYTLLFVWTIGLLAYDVLV